MDGGDGGGQNIDEKCRPVCQLTALQHSMSINLVESVTPISLRATTSTRKSNDKHNSNKWLLSAIKLDACAIS